jgi:hypothetical protein
MRVVAWVARGVVGLLGLRMLLAGLDQRPQAGQNLSGDPLALQPLCYQTIDQVL